ncbi:1990_t:CDS:2, partial [Gigaspora margarita]
NSRLPITTVFENISDPVNSPVLQNFNVVYDQIHTIECSDYDSEQTICFRWQIEKQWCITQFSQDNTTGFVQFNTGFYWFVTVNNINEPLRHLKYMSDEMKVPDMQWIDLNVNNAQAIRDLGEEIRDLKRKLVEDREERDNKRPNNNNENNRPNDNNTPIPTTTSNTPTTTIPSTSTT